MDNRRSEQLTWAFSSSELKTTQIKTNLYNVIVIKKQILAFYSLITCTKPNSNYNGYSLIQETSWGVWRGTNDPLCRVCPSSGSRYKTSHWAGSVQESVMIGWEDTILSMESSVNDFLAPMYSEICLFQYAW